MTDSDTVYANTEPAAIGYPEDVHAAVGVGRVVRDVARYGPRNTVTTVVANAEFAQS